MSASRLEFASPFREGLPKEGGNVVRLQAAGVGAFHRLGDLLHVQRRFALVQRVPAYQVLDFLGIDRSLDHLRQPLPYLVLRAVPNRLDQEVAQRLLLTEADGPEHVEDLATQRLALLLQLGE